MATSDARRHTTLVALLMLWSCTPTPPVVAPPKPPPPTRPPSPTAKKVSSPFRVMRGLKRHRAWVKLDDGDGVLLRSGQRIKSTSVGLEVAEVVTKRALMSAVRIPQAMGGGFLFSNNERIYHAEEFLGDLRLVARDGGIELGPDFVLTGSGRAIALPLPARGEVSLSPPPMAGMKRVATNAAGHAVALLIGGTIVLRPAGKPRWERAKLRARTLSWWDDAVIVTTETGATMTLNDRGELVSWEGKRDRLRAAKLATAIERGVVDAEGRTLIAAGGDLLSVDLTSETITRVGPAPGKDCVLIGKGARISATCDSAAGRRKELFDDVLGTPRKVLDLGERTAIFVDPSGALAFAAPCPGSTSKTGSCMRDRGGRFVSGVAPRGHARWLLPTPDGLVALHGNYELKRDEAEEVIEGLALPSRRARLGTVHRDFVVRRDGSAALHTEQGFMVLRGSRVEKAPWMRHVAFAADHAVAFSGDRLFQSDDAARTWVEVSAPPLRQQDPDLVCGATACRIGDLVRLGWPEDEPTEVPPQRWANEGPLEWSPRQWRWRLRCEEESVWPAAFPSKSHRLGAWKRPKPNGTMVASGLSIHGAGTRNGLVSWHLPKHGSAIRTIDVVVPFDTKPTLLRHRHTIKSAVVTPQHAMRNTLDSYPSSSLLPVVQQTSPLISSVVGIGRRIPYRLWIRDKDLVELAGPVRVPLSAVQRAPDEVVLAMKENRHWADTRVVAVTSTGQKTLMTVPPERSWEHKPNRALAIHTASGEVAVIQSGVLLRKGKLPQALPADDAIAPADDARCQGRQGWRAMVRVSGAMLIDIGRNGSPLHGEMLATFDSDLICIEAITDGELTVRFVPQREAVRTRVGLGYVHRQKLSCKLEPN